MRGIARVQGLDARCSIVSADRLHQGSTVSHCKRAAGINDESTSEAAQLIVIAGQRARDGKGLTKPRICLLRHSALCPGRMWQSPWGRRIRCQCRTACGDWWRSSRRCRGW